MASGISQYKSTNFNLRVHSARITPNVCGSAGPLKSKFAGLPSDSIKTLLRGLLSRATGILTYYSTANRVWGQDWCFTITQQWIVDGLAALQGYRVTGNWLYIPEVQFLVEGFPFPRRCATDLSKRGFVIIKWLTRGEIKGGNFWVLVTHCHIANTCHWCTDPDTELLFMSIQTF